MNSFFLAIPLPATTRTRLTSLCFGLQNVRWVEEENFHITLRYLGYLSDNDLQEIQEHLKSIYFSPFFVVLQGVSHFNSKGNRGTLWVGIAENPPLTQLIKEMNQLLKGFSLKAEEHAHPYITLGRYDHLNFQKLGDFLSTFEHFQSEPIEVKSCLLMRTLQTPKRVIYETVEEYTASPLELGED